MTLTLQDWSTPRRFLLVTAGVMMVTAALSMQQYFAAHYPAAAAAGSGYDLGPFFNCTTAAYSRLAAPWGIPLGWFGMSLAALLILATLFPSAALERTSRALALLNGAAVLALLLYSVVALRSLCLLCAGYALASLLAAWLLARHRDEPLLAAARPAVLHLATIAVVIAGGALAVREYHWAARDAHRAQIASRAVNQFFSLPQVPWPSRISPYWSVRSTVRFEDAPIRIVEYADPLCSDCRVFFEQLKQLEREFEGKLNVAFQFFPLEAACNDVVTKDLHAGACELSYIAAYDASKFRAIHDEIYENFQFAKRDTAWRRELARRHGVADALTDRGVRERVRQLIETGAEYERTSERFEYGIRSTPTLIVNNRMIIGTLPTAQLRAIFRALVDAQELEGAKFLENWVEPGCVIPDAGGPPAPCGPDGQ